MDSSIVLVVGILMTLLLIGIGYALKYKKAYWLIPGYNTMTEERKRMVDVEHLAGFLARSCYVSAIILLLSSLFFRQQFIFASSRSPLHTFFLGSQTVRLELCMTAYPKP